MRNTIVKMEQHALFWFTNLNKGHVIFTFTLKLNDYQLLAAGFEEQTLCTPEAHISPTVPLSDSCPKRANHFEFQCMDISCHVNSGSQHFLELDLLFH